jgi:hypothetical protein
MRIKISDEDPIPPPEKRGRPKGSSKYPAAKLLVGQSFFIPATMVKAASVFSTVSRFNRALAPKKFTARSTPRGCTVWRVE